MFRHVLLPLAAGGSAALLLAACGSSDTTTAGVSGAATSSSQSAAVSTAATISVAANPLGQILVDSQGRSLYLWEADTGTQSTCSGACAHDWPPVLTSGAPVAGTGVNAGLLGTTTRSDGTTQVTYNKHPLYGYIVDKAAGDTKGEANTAYGAGWYVLAPSGSKIDNN
jgi:predicted lipoprotein with Yx(FWY)xxD motif